MNCSCCGNKITLNNNGLFLTEELLSFEEQVRLQGFKKDICCECKRELFFANIIAAV
jgi:hypothetical protein